jgi:hypothetical protein
MTTEQLKKVHGKKPFEAFTLYLADGRDVSISHPELLTFSASGRTVHVHDASECEEIIDLLLVVSLRLSGPHQAALRSGRR